MNRERPVCLRSRGLAHKSVQIYGECVGGLLDGGEVLRLSVLIRVPVRARVSRVCPARLPRCLLNNYWASLVRTEYVAAAAALDARTAAWYSRTAGTAASAVRRQRTAVPVGAPI